MKYTKLAQNTYLGSMTMWECVECDFRHAFTHKDWFALSSTIVIHTVSCQHRFERDRVLRLESEAHSTTTSCANFRAGDIQDDEELLNIEQIFKITDYSVYNGRREIFI